MIHEHTRAVRCKLYLSTNPEFPGTKSELKTGWTPFPFNFLFLMYFLILSVTNFVYVEFSINTNTNTNMPLNNNNLIHSAVGIAVRTAETGIEGSNPTQGALSFFFFHFFQHFSKKCFLAYEFTFFSKVIYMFFSPHDVLFHIPKAENNFFESDDPISDSGYLQCKIIWKNLKEFSRGKNASPKVSEATLQVTIKVRIFYGFINTVLLP